MSTTLQRVRELVEPIAVDLGVSVYDIEHSGGVLRILLQREQGVDLGVLTDATRRISAELDQHDPLPGSYTLEVSSPGLERPLRTEEHFAGAVGELVKVKTRAGTEGGRRVDGELVRVDGSTLTIRTDDGERTVHLDEIDRARTHVEWTPPPKPGAPGSGKAKKSKAATAGQQPRPAADAPASGSTSPSGSTTPQSEATP